MSDFWFSRFDKPYRKYHKESSWSLYLITLDLLLVNYKLSIIYNI